MLQIVKATGDAQRKKIIKVAKSNELFVLKDLVKSVVEKKIDISREIFDQLVQSGKIPYILRQFKNVPNLHKDKTKLKSTLFKINKVLPLFIRAILKDE